MNLCFCRFSRRGLENLYTDQTNASLFTRGLANPSVVRFPPIFCPKSSFLSAKSPMPLSIRVYPRPSVV